MRELVAVQKEVIERMIDCADNWEERNNQLKVGLKKHKEHFNRLIEKCRDKANEGEVD